MLRAKLFEVEQKKQEEKMGNIHAQKKAIEWGSQIRSYVLAPYRLVTDHRTEIKVGNVDAVLDGDLDQFMIATLLELAGDPTAAPCYQSARSMTCENRSRTETIHIAVDCLQHIEVKSMGWRLGMVWVTRGEPWLTNAT